MRTIEKTQERFHPLLKETIYYDKISPGLDTYVFPRKGYQKKYAVYAVNYGSIDTRYRNRSGKIVKLPQGTAHFLEHKMFEQKDRNVFDEFSKKGASANAFTSFGHTAYLFSATENFYECLNTLLDFVNEPYFTKESVEKEQGIISQEIRMYQDNPDWKVFFNMLEGIYHNHPVNINIAGTEEEIGTITPELLYDCHKTFYHPSNMVLFIIGDLDVAEVFSEVDKNLSAKNLSPSSDLDHRTLPSEPESVFMSQKTDEHDISKPRAYIGFKDQVTKQTETPSLKDEIVTDFLLELIFGKGSKIYQSLLEEGLIDNQFEFSYSHGEGFGFSLIGGPTKDPDKLIHKLEKGIETTFEEGIDKRDFQRIKNKLLGDYIQGFNSLEYLANTFLNLYFSDAFLFDYSEILNQISIDELHNRLANHLYTENKTKSLLYPSN
ncbi:EF-P 5-aminopentanol modification-associated protein YfmH [Natranaerobius thermophilus]|uniref:Peptidase M16 domain protein n=1 Tax=Natranaerobius thermophilus (strain ATCC BAA-1301 / DSM 18059 / JW/NM-WN-LF) TaxID=457570 RepID=B2A650_NATTJ|nr:pitrilysin family protein [Natranaerobius thermophilus]ACB85467.1 peptidase M16 domain protein [Natranaerobius thermophilus JW/NM-WN-LF]